MRTHASLAREVMLAIFSSVRQMDTAELVRTTGRTEREVLLGLEYLKQRRLVDHIGGQDVNPGWTLKPAVDAALEILGRTTAALDRHVAEALHLRERGGRV